MSTLHRQIIGDLAELHRRSSGSSTPRSQSRARASSQRERFRTTCPSTATCNNGKQRLGWPVFPCVDRAVQTYWDGVSHEERPPSQSLTCGMRPAQRLGASGGWEVDNAAVSASGFQQCSPQSCGAHPAEGLGPQQPWQVHGVSKCASGMQNPAIGTSQPSSVPPCGAQSVPGRGGYLHDEFMGATGIQQPSTIPTCGTHSAQTMGSIGMQRPSPTISGAHPAKNVFSCGGRPAHDESVAASGTQQVQEIPAHIQHLGTHQQTWVGMTPVSILPAPRLLAPAHLQQQILAWHQLPLMRMGSGHKEFPTPIHRGCLTKPTVK